jgi:nicotinamidase-related amidase
MANDSARETGWSGGHGPVVAPLSPHPEDVVIPREQGLTGFFGTGLDAYLRNTGVRTVIVTGVSLNIAVLGTAIEGMNLGYQVIVPNDCTAATAGTPTSHCATRDAASRWSPSARLSALEHAPPA